MFYKFHCVKMTGTKQPKNELMCRVSGYRDSDASSGKFRRKTLKMYIKVLFYCCYIFSVTIDEIARSNSNTVDSKQFIFVLQN